MESKGVNSSLRIILRAPKSLDTAQYLSYILRNASDFACYSLFAHVQMAAIIPRGVYIGTDLQRPA